MDSTLTHSCRDYFYRRDMDRGEALYESDGVSLLEGGTGGALAKVRGQSEPYYLVGLNFAGLDRNQLGVNCNCPRAMDGFLCKHVWATLLACEGLGLKVPSDLDLVECPADRIRIGAPLAKSGKRSGRSPRWREQLRSLSQSVSGVPEETLPTFFREASQQAQYWFVISLTDQIDEPYLTIRLYQSTRKKDGQWSQLKPSSLSRYQIDTLSDPLEREALQLLEADSSTSFSYSVVKNLRIRPGATDATMRLLAATGRLVWSLEVGRRVLDPQPMVWDGGKPYRLRVSVKPHVGEDQKQRIRVTPELVRDDHLLPLSDVLLASDEGILLLQERACLLAAHHAKVVRQWQAIGKIDVPARSLPALLDEAVQWQGIDLCIDPDLPVEIEQPQPRPRLHLASPEHAENTLQATVLMVYGDEPQSVADGASFCWDRKEKRLTQRDLAAEARWLESLPQECFRGVREGMLQVSRRTLPELVSQLTAEGWEVIANDRAIRHASSFQLSVESGQDWFDLNATADFDGVRASLPELLAALRKGQDFVLLDDGSHGVLPTEWLEKFADFDKTGKIEEDSIRFTKTQALLLDALLAEQENVAYDRAFQAWCEKLNSFAGIEPVAAPAGFEGTLREYQQLGLGWFQFLQEFRLGGCLADDMGLGKTIQVLAMLEQRRTRALSKDEQRLPSLVVVPKSLVFNWLEEAAKFAPQLRVLNYTGTDRMLQRDAFGEFDVIVTTYGTLRNDVTHLRENAFDYVILDEAQAIKNPQSLAAKASRLLESEHRLAMTGTPVENHLGDLWSLFDFLNPGMLGRAMGTVHSAAAATDEGRLQQISLALRPFILRRTKEQVLTELPAKTEQTLYCDMAPKQRKLYDQLRDHYRALLTKKIKTDGLAKSKIQVLEALLRLRQAACDPRLLQPTSKARGAKLIRLAEQIEEVVGEGHKALVFSQFTSLLALVRTELDERGCNYAYLDGKTSRRQAQVERFQNDDDCPLFLISLKAGGHGLNLTAADYVFILDPWWNPAVEAQAIDRAHRMGQTKPVVAYRMICRGTVEEKIVDLQASKRKLADAIISQEKSLVSELTSDDLRMLFS